MSSLPRRFASFALFLTMLPAPAWSESAAEAPAGQALVAEQAGAGEAAVQGATTPVAAPAVDAVREPATEVSAASPVVDPELAAARARVAELEQALAEQEQARRGNLGRIAQLKEAGDAARQRAVALDDRLAERERELAEARALLEEQEQALLAGKSAVQSLETALGATDTALADARAELAVREASLAEVQGLYDASMARIATMEMELVAARAETDEARQGIEAARNESAARVAELETALRELLKTNLIRVVTLPDERIRIRMSADRIFLAGQPVVSPEGVAMLAEIHGLLSQAGLGQIRVEVHEDREPGLRTGRSDRELSRARAEVLVGQLALATGLPTQRFLAVGDGASRPIASNVDPAGRALNRRVEIYVPTASRVMPRAIPPAPALHR
ncbi:MAG: OmpA family protein [Chromatiales bacterium]|nr:OmpA family protein [Gammaproteobacteria bacterium]MCP5353052.1 OmpA family protein [Chromatiales bacterium]